MAEKYRSKDHQINGEKALTRRHFCCLAAALPAGAFLAACHGSAGFESGDRSVPLCPAADVKMGKTKFALESLLLVRDKDGIAAMTMTCTHERCSLSMEQGGEAPIVCPCHGSLFSERGDVLKGPATVPLPWYDVHIDEQGMVIVNLAVKKSPEWRFKV